MRQEQQDIFETHTNMKQSYRTLFAEYLKTCNPIYLHTISIRLMAHNELSKRLRQDLGEKYNNIMLMFSYYINTYKAIELRDKDIEKSKDEKYKKILREERDLLRAKVPLIEDAVHIVFEKLISYCDLQNIPVQSALVKSQQDNRRPMGFPMEGEFFDERFG